jgi:hypothetical protein
MMKRNMFKQALTLSAFLVLVGICHNGYSQMGGMGGMGMSGAGMMGPGGMMGGGMGGMAGPAPLAVPLVVWSKPTGETPIWLASGQRSIDSSNLVRMALAETKSCELVEEPLEQALQKLIADTSISLELDRQGISDNGATLDDVVTLTANAPLRDILSRLLKPRDLSYCVRDGYLLITSSDVAYDSPSNRTYDLSHIMSDNANVSQLLNTIQLTISPDLWVEQGGVNVVTVLGSMLVVRADEETHQELEKLLYIYSTSATPSASANTDS